MDIDKKIDDILRESVEREQKPIIEAIRKHINTYIQSASFQMRIQRSVRDHIFNMIEDDGPMACLPEKEVNEILHRAVRSVIK